MTKSVEVIIISYNTRILTSECVESILNNSPDVQITVVDNASTDNSASWIRDNYPTVKVIRNDTNKGYAGAVNIGVNSSESDIVIISNSDVQFHHKTIEKLVLYMEMHEDVGVVGPQQVYPDGSWQRSYGIVPSLKEALFNVLGLSSLNNFVHRLMWPKVKIDYSIKDVGYADGACLCVRRSAFNDVEGFDESFFFYGEEADFCYRLRKSGWKVQFCPFCTIMHIRGGSSKKSIVSENNLTMLFRNKAKIVNKHWGYRNAIGYIRLSQLYTIPRWFVASLGAFLWCSRFEQKQLIFRAHYSIWKRIKEEYRYNRKSESIANRLD